ncbi:MAG: transporter substrate-binding domain-containing protein [Candidatus Saganbacteria bacterium]|nr:transporter substrate-binding domain-containing protein [Candidatus Saganbacteria bacterium]
MKKRYMLLLVIVLLVLAAAFLVSGRKENRDYLLASGHPEYPPFMWQEGSRIVGVGPEILSEACKEIGVPLKIEFKGSWDDVMNDVRIGRIDAVVALYRTDQRTKYLNYSISYAKDPVVVFVRKDKIFAYHKWDDLIGKSGTTTVGDSFGQAFDSFMEDKLDVSRLNTVKENFEALNNGTADFFVYGLYSGLFESKKLGLENKIAYLKPYLTTENWYLAFSKTSKYAKYLPEINRTISKMTARGTVDKLAAKYTLYYEESVLNRVKRLVESGLKYYAEQGQTKAFAEFDNIKGKFSQGDLYLFVFDLKGKCLAHGADHSLIGRDLMDLKDVDGKQFVKEFITIARDPGQGWVSYKWKYKNTNEIGPKISYIMKIKGKDLLIGCGFYTDK